MNYTRYRTGFFTLLNREILRFARIWIQTVLPPSVTMALYFVIFGRLIGSQIGAVHGVAYIDYIVPGLILMAVIQHSYANVVSSFYGAKFQRHIEEMLVAPMPPAVILLGFIAGGIARGVTVGVAVTAVSWIFTPLKLHHALALFGTGILTATLFSLAGLINGVYAKSFDDISLIPTFVLTPLTYLGGIFFSIDMLSGIWREIALWNPILYMVSAFRYGYLGIAELPLWRSYAVLLFCIVALGAYALRLLRRGVGIRS